MKYLQKVFILLTASLAATLISTTAYAATFTVDTANDELDGACPAGDCSLREAIAAASNGDTVTFDVSLDGSTITLSGVLGTVTVGKTLTIDGDIDGGAGPDITIDGTGLSDNAVAVAAASVTIDGMIIWGGTTSGHNAIYVSGASFTLKNSMVNTDGTTNKKDASTAIRLSAASASIGTGVASEGNQIGGTIHVNDTSGHSILGNWIGISSAGNDIAPSTDQSSGISITGTSASTVTIGGSGNSKNIISNFDSNNAIKIENSNSSTAITISGNYLGTTVPGTAAAANQTGVYVSGEVTGTVNIGTSSIGNVISGNTTAGVYLKSGNTATVTLLKNYIGTNDGGTSAVPNPLGLRVEGCTTLTIGDSFNIISGNTSNGISLANSSCTVSITGAYIGLAADGSTVVGNGGNGVSVESTGGTLAIGTVVGSVNVISGNTGHGISVDSSATITPTIRNNYIGLNAAGTAAKANGWNGIKLQKPANVYSNKISGNTWHGIQLMSTVTSADIQSNYIGLNAAGTSAVANGYSGIHVSGATGVAIGASSGANVISGNTQSGILINSSGSATILGNKIGTDATGAVTTVGNGNSQTGATYYGGIMVDTASAIIGSGVAGNTIKGNYGQGVIGINPTSLTIKGNTINSNIAGVTPGLANGSGFVVTDSAGGSASTIAIGGTGSGEGNTISENAENGISFIHQLGGLGISGITIYGNTIGSSGAGNIGDGIKFVDTTPGGNITSVTIGSSSGANTITYNGSNGIELLYVTSGTIASNTITNNTKKGILLTASSPTISTNTISSNGSNGIRMEASYGSDSSPSVTADDVRSLPTITSNTFSMNTEADIYAFDTAATNKSTLHTDNTITNTSGINGIEQVWYGALAYTCNGTALSSAISSVSVNGSSSAFTAYNGGYWGPASFSYSNVTTWGQIKEFIYTSSGGKTTYSPNAITVTPTSGATSCDATTSSGTFSGSSYYQTASIALTLTPTGGGVIFTSRSSSRSTTTTETTEEETEASREEEATTEATEEETSRDESSTEETTTETTTRETPTYAREETYDRYSPSEATSTESTRETSTASTETPSERVERVMEILGVTEQTAVTEAVSRAIETITADTADADNDGITNAEEITRGTNANSFDSDGDGDPDSRDPSPSDATVISETWTELSETADRDSNENGMSDKAEYLFGAETTSRDLVFGSDNGDINLGLSQMAFVTSEGFAVTGTGKPNSKTNIRVTLANGSEISTDVETDANGLYIATFDSSILTNVKADDLLLITSEKGKEVLAKVTNETIKKPEVKIEGLGIEETNEENSAQKYWSTELVMNKIPEWIKSTSLGNDYSKKLIEEAKKETITLKGYTEPNSAVMFVFKSATFSSVVISDKEGYFEMEVPKELKDELSQNADTESMLHEFIGFSVDYKTNKISPLVKGLFRIYNLNLSLNDQTG